MLIFAVQNPSIPVSRIWETTLHPFPQIYNLLHLCMRILRIFGERTFFEPFYYPFHSNCNTLVSLPFTPLLSNFLHKINFYENKPIPETVFEQYSFFNEKTQSLLQYFLGAVQIKWCVTQTFKMHFHRALRISITFGRAFRP